MLKEAIVRYGHDQRGEYMANRNGTARGVDGRSESDMTKRSSHDTREEQELRRFDQRFHESFMVG